jgi:hypothetical protein
MELQPLHTITVDAEQELVEKIRWEIQLRGTRDVQSPTEPSDMPGDSLVALAGELSLSVPESALSVYRLNLWPEIRRMVGSPVSIVEGSYQYAIARTVEVGNSLYREPVRTPETDEKPKPDDQTDFGTPIPPEIYEKLRGTLGEWSSTSDVFSSVDMPLWTSSFRVGSALSTFSPVETRVLSILMLRLDAGFFLAGLETLWPQEAPMLKRELWHTGKLKDWDELLQVFSMEMALHAQEFKLSLSPSQANLYSDHFGPLPKILEGTPSFPDLDLPDVELSSELGFEDSSSDSGLRPWELMAIHDMVMQYFPDAMESGFLKIGEPDPSGFVKVTSSLTNHTIGICLAKRIEGVETIALPDSTVVQSLSGIWILRSEDISDAVDEEDYFIIPVHSVGFITGNQLALLKPLGSSEAASDLIRFDQMSLKNDDWFHLLVPSE